MRTVERHRARIVPLVVALALAGCATGGLVNMWKDPDYPKAPLHNVFVVAVKKDPVRRRMMEDAFVAALIKEGVTATSSYRQFADALPDTQQVVAIVKANRYDGVLVVSKLDTKVTKNDVPGSTTTEARSEWNRWTGRYQTYYAQVEVPGYTETETVVRHRVDLWTTEDGGRMVWTATGNSINPNSSEDVTREITRKIVPELVRQGILVKQ